MESSGGAKPKGKRQKAKPSATGTREDSEVRATEVLDGHIVKKSKVIYTGKMNRMVAFMKELDEKRRISLPESNRLEPCGLKLKLPVDEKDLLNFYGYISQHEDGANKSVSDLGGYTSALSNEYKVRKIAQPESA
jgi:hypothetical protein